VPWLAHQGTGYELLVLYPYRGSELLHHRLMTAGDYYVITISGAKSEMVGTIGFEPTTYCSQSSRATKLRHVPLI
jgi:hypothetical protein